jgi:hypothetical protein
MRLSIGFQVVTRTISGLLSLLLLAQTGLAPTAAQAQTQPAWLVSMNNIRTAAGLPAVVEDSASTTGAIHHSRYVVMNTLTHTEDPSKPGYTADGAAAGQIGDVGAGGSVPAPQDAIAGFMTAGYHWEPILDPGLTSVGYGTSTCAEAFPGQTNPPCAYGAAQTLVFNRSFAHASKPIMWPPSGGTMPYTSYTGGETPNPLASCSGYSTPTGASLSLQLPSTPQVTSVALTKAGTTGALASCWFTGATVKFSPNDQAWVSTGTSILNGANAVVIFPQQSLANGTYCVSVTNAGTPIQWSFTVGGSPVTPPAPCGSGSGSSATATPVPAAPTATPSAGTPGRLAAPQQLNSGDQLLSANGKTRLIMQTDGNLCLYRVDTGAWLWCSGTAGKGGTHVVMQTDGNFVLYTSNNTPVWSSGTSGHPGAGLVLGDDGNLVVGDTNGAQLWASNTSWNTQAPAPTATPVASSSARLIGNQDLKVNQKLTAANGKAYLIMQTDSNLCLYRDSGAWMWCSNSFGKGGTHTLMQTDGNFVMYTSTGTPVWSTGTFGHPGASVVLRDDGNLVVVDANGAQLWASNTSLT